MIARRTSSGRWVVKSEYDVRFERVALVYLIDGGNRGDFMWCWRCSDRDCLHVAEVLATESAREAS